MLFISYKDFNKLLTKMCIRSNGLRFILNLFLRPEFEFNATQFQEFPSIN
jgi:hypothetical protein